MPITLPSVPNVGDPTTRQLILTIIQAITDLAAGAGGSGGTSSGSLLLNGSFEVDSDGNSIPDNWTRTLQTNGAGEYTGTGQTDTDCVSGSKAYKFTTIGGSGNGGGQLQSDFFEVTPFRPLKVSWFSKSTTSGVARVLKVDYYDASQSFISPTDTIFSQGAANPSGWIPEFGCSVPPATARYAKVTVVGGDSSSTSSGSVYFDGVRVDQLDFLRRSTIHGSGTTARQFSWRAKYTGPHRITCIGGGGAGAGSSSSTRQPGGGSGQLVQAVVNLTAGSYYPLSIGGGGLGVSGATGGNGGDTFFDSINVNVGAGGGGGGTTGGSPGAGGTGSVSTPDTIEIDGNAGDPAIASTSNGNGGDSVLGLMGGVAVANESGATPDVNSFGAGGAGSSAPTITRAGASGGAGAIIIEW